MSKPRPKERRRARILALQTLFAYELSQADTPEECMELVFEHREPGAVDLDYARRLVLGVAAEMTSLDRIIGAHSHEWSVPRMAAVDRNLLRLGAYEITRVDQVPPGVAIDEAVEIAKQFGGEKTPSFVNAILDEVRRQAAPDPGATSEPSSEASPQLQPADPE